jgi:hypothetical protein
MAVRHPPVRSRQTRQDASRRRGLVEHSPPALALRRGAAPRPLPVASAPLGSGRVARRIRRIVLAGARETGATDVCAGRRQQRRGRAGRPPDHAARRMAVGRRARHIAGGLAVAASVYAFGLRRAILRWGATAGEALAQLPGDELLEDADGCSTRAITIDAPPSDVWPWLAQMGPAPRGGAYTYDWIENVLGLDMHSADEVLPQFQHPAPGDEIAFGRNRMRLERVQRERVLAWRSADGNWVWTFVLAPDGQRTRLISRNRYRLPTLAARAGMLTLEPGSLVMERRMLLGIRERAQRLAAQRRG